MTYDFSFVPDRSNTGSIKWTNEYKNCFPFSVADMEWRTAPAIRKALSAFAENGFYCYTAPDEKYRRVVCDFMKRRHNWEISPDWIVCTYGIVSAIHTAVKAFTNKGNGVIIQSPVYHHFAQAVTLNNRQLINNPLVIKNGRYEMNFEQLEQLCKDENNKMLVLCSPHNPVGRVWTKEELTRVAEICYENSVLLVSDEIHFDITKNPHTVLTSIDEKYNENTIVCTAASKSFNIAGLGTSNIIIANTKLREIFENMLKIDGYDCINAFSYPTLLAAYTQCDEWLDEMNKHIQNNYALIADFVKKYMPKAFLSPLEGTYLVWLDVSFLGIEDEKLVEFFAEKTGIIPSAGFVFGDEGKGFIRLDIACPESVIVDALERMKGIL